MERIQRDGVINYRCWNRPPADSSPRDCELRPGNAANKINIIRTVSAFMRVEMIRSSVLRNRYIRLHGSYRETRERIPRYPISNCILIAGRNRVLHNCNAMLYDAYRIRLEMYDRIGYDRVASGNCS